MQAKHLLSHQEHRVHSLQKWIINGDTTAKGFVIYIFFVQFLPIIQLATYVFVVQYFLINSKAEKQILFLNMKKCVCWKAHQSDVMREILKH